VCADSLKNVCVVCADSFKNVCAVCADSFKNVCAVCADSFKNVCAVCADSFENVCAVCVHYILKIELKSVRWECFLKPAITFLCRNCKTAGGFMCEAQGRLFL